jgi:hypothetical protein
MWIPRREGCRSELKIRYIYIYIYRKGKREKKGISAVFYWSATAAERRIVEREQGAQRELWETLESFRQCSSSIHVYRRFLSIDSTTPHTQHTAYNRPKPFRHLLPGCCMWHVICASILFPFYFLFYFSFTYILPFWGGLYLYSGWFFFVRDPIHRTAESAESIYFFSSAILLGT